MKNPDSLIVLNTLYFGFFSVLFLQSGLDKLFNFKSNKEWYHSFFQNSLFKGWEGLLLSALMLTELAAGICSLTSVFWLWLGEGIRPMTVAIMLNLASLLFVFTGQRVAKDYQGAASTVPYFIAALIGWFTIFR
jgi:putative oxidoreductase